MEQLCRALIPFKLSELGSSHYSATWQTTRLSYTETSTPRRHFYNRTFASKASLEREALHNGSQARQVQELCHQPKDAWLPQRLPRGAPEYGEA